MTRRGTALGLLALGGLLGLVASAQPWWRAVAGPAVVTVSGTEATGGLSQALALVALAGTLLALALRARGRRVVAVLLGLTGLSTVLTGALRTAPSTEAIRARLRQVSLAEEFAVRVTAWPWMVVAAGCLVLLGAVGLWWGAPRWGRRPPRFERPSAAVAAAVVPDDLAEDPVRVWQAQDAGLDPTVPASPGPSRRSADPDVQPEGGGDRMGHRTDPEQST
jgi:uncharacterized membrane protein (TIGR02234 family)